MVLRRADRRAGCAAGRGVRALLADAFERLIVNGTLIGGATGLVRAGSAFVRAGQSGLLRFYAGLMLLGIAAVGLYFLIQG